MYSIDSCEGCWYVVKFIVSRYWRWTAVRMHRSENIVLKEWLSVLTSSQFPAGPSPTMNSLMMWHAEKQHRYKAAELKTSPSVFIFLSAPWKDWRPGLISSLSTLLTSSSLCSPQGLRHLEKLPVSEEWFIHPDTSLSGFGMVTGLMVTYTPVLKLECR